MESVANASTALAVAEPAVALPSTSRMCRASCKGAPASALNNATSRSAMWKGRGGMVRRSMSGCESYSSAGVGVGKRRCAHYALSRAIVCPVKAAGFDGIFIAKFLNSVAVNICPDLHPKGINVQNIRMVDFISQGLRDTSIYSN